MSCSVFIDDKEASIKDNAFLQRNDPPKIFKKTLIKELAAESISERPVTMGWMSVYLKLRVTLNNGESFSFSVSPHELTKAKEAFELYKYPALFDYEGVIKYQKSNAEYNNIAFKVVVFGILGIGVMIGLIVGGVYYWYDR